MAGCCQHGHETSVSIKCGKCVDHLRDCQLCCNELGHIIITLLWQLDYLDVMALFLSVCLSVHVILVHI
jgi:hypothetical protein